MRKRNLWVCLSHSQDATRTYDEYAYTSPYILTVFYFRLVKSIDYLAVSNAEHKTVQQMSQELDEQRDLASNRLAELEETNGYYKDALKEVERLKMELSTLPEHVVVETTEHKCLQSQFSVLYNEAMQLKTQLDESRGQLQVNLHA